MDTQKNAEKLKCQRGLKYFHGEAATAASGEAGNAYGPASMVVAGADAQGVGMLVTLTNLVSAFLYLKVPSIIGKIGSRKKAIIWMAALDAIGWLPLIFVLLFLRPLNPLWLIPLWIVNLVPGMVLCSARDSWLADLVPSGTLGRYFGMRTALSGAMYLATYYFMGYILQLNNRDVLNGFIMVFSIAFIASCFTFLFYSIIRDPVNKVESDVRIKVFKFLREMRGGKPGRLIFYVALFNFAVYLSSPYVAVYLLSDLKVSYITFAIVTSAEFLAKILIVTFWGRYADRVGNLKVIRIVSLMIPLVPLFWFISPPVAALLILIQLFSGVAWAGFDLCTATFIYETVTPNKRLGYITFNKGLVTLAKALGVLTGAAVIPFVAPILGHKTLVLFLISGVLRFVVVAVVLPKVLQVVKGLNIPTKNQAAMATAEWALAHSRGLYYRPSDWMKIGRKKTSPMHAVQAHNSGKGLLSKYGLIYHKEDWAKYRRTTLGEILIACSQGGGEIESINRGIFYHPEDWGKFNRVLVSEKSAAHVHTKEEVVISGRDLLHRPEQWSGFGRAITGRANSRHQLRPKYGAVPV